MSSVRNDTSGDVFVVIEMKEASKLPEVMFWLLLQQ